MHILRQLLKSASGTIILLTFSWSAFAGDFHLARWPFLDTLLQDPEALKHDMLTGRLVCPALTRFHPKKRQSEPLILKDVATNTAQTIFTFTLRTGIYWWQGDPVTPKDVASFITNHLHQAAFARAADLWQVPKFRITTTHTQVAVEFEKAPPFKAYIFNDMPFFRDAQTPLGYECAGIFTPELQVDRLILWPTKAYNQGHQRLILDKAYGGDLFFSLASDYKVEAFDEQNSHMRLNCDQSLPIPYATAIEWNPSVEATVRQQLYPFIPLDTLVEAGARGLATTIRLGKTSQKDFRQTRKLTFAQAGPAMNLVEKVVVDAFLAHGMEIKTLQAHIARAEWDFRIKSIPWSTYGKDLFHTFHNNGSAIDTKAQDMTLEKVLESYSASLTGDRPDEGLYQEAMKKIFDMGSIYPLLHHRVCVHFRDRALSMQLKLNPEDPDWMRHIAIARQAM